LSFLALYEHSGLSPALSYYLAGKLRAGAF